MDVAKLELKVPAGRAQCITPWLASLGPDATADVLELGQKAYAAVSAALAAGSDAAARAAWEEASRQRESERKRLQDRLDALEADAAESARRCREREEDAARQGRAAAATDLAALRSEVDALRTDQRQREEAALRAAYDDNEAFRALVKSCQADKDTALREAAQHHREGFMRPLEALSSAVGALTKTATAVGQLGENVVFDVHSGLNLGVLEDRRKDNRTPGNEDYLWVWRALRTNLEVKNVNRLHSVHDMEKHVAKMSEAASSGGANSGLFISLKARIPGKPLLSVDYVAGLPVLYVGAAGDPGAVELAFYAAAQLLPTLVSGGAGSAKAIVPAGSASAAELDAMRVHLLSSCEALRSLQRRIEDLDRVGRTVGSTAEGLRKVKAGLFDALAAVRTAVPALTQEPEPAQASRPCEIMSRVCDHFRDAGKWPTQWKDIGLKRDSALVRAATREKKKLSHFVAVAVDTVGSAEPSAPPGDDDSDEEQ
jgi:hypothetical protein